MLKFVADEDLNRSILRGLIDRLPELDIVRVQEAGLMGTPDPEILCWAAERGRIVITHDVNTMTDYAYQRVRSGRPMPGVFHVPQSAPLGAVIEDILLLAQCSVEEEWAGRVLHLPLK